jgi:hypothetical protein
MLLARVLTLLFLLCLHLLNFISGLLSNMGSKFFGAYGKRADGAKQLPTKWGDEGVGSGVDFGPLSPTLSDGEEQSSPPRHAVRPRQETSSSSLFANRPLKSLLREPEVKTSQIHKPTLLTERPKIATRTQTPSELSTVLSKLSILETKVVSLEKRLEASEKRNIAFSDNITKAIADASKKNTNSIQRGLEVSREDMTTVVSAINKHTTDLIQELASIMPSERPQSPSEDVPVAEGEIVVIAPNNPREGVHKSTVDEIVAMMGEDNIYLCSSFRDFKDGIEIARAEAIGEVKEDETARSERLNIGTE